jgi:excisionase family DNA binding protein
MTRRTIDLSLSISYAICVRSQTEVHSTKNGESKVNEVKLYKVPEAAQALGLSRAKVYELVASGAIGSVKIDASRRIPAQDLHRFVERLRIGEGLAVESDRVAAGVNATAA